MGGAAPDRQVTLRDGRRLGCCDPGEAAGYPILYFHGFPGSRLETRLSGVDPAALGIRLIGVDRPGMGLSDFQPGRRFSHWPDDVAQLADALGLGRFSVVGVSGGGPYVAACALALSQRLDAAGIVCGVGPMDAPGARQGMGLSNRVLFALSRPGTWLAWLPTAVMGAVLRSPVERFQSRLGATLPEPDRAILTGRPEVARALVEAAREAYRGGLRGPTLESVLYARRWDVDLRAIPMKVHLWQGERDRNVAPAMGRHLAAEIPDCEAVFLPEEGHLSLPVRHMGAILEALRDRAAGAGASA